MNNKKLLSDSDRSGKKIASITIYRIVVYLLTAIIVSCCVILKFCVYNVGSNKAVSLQMPARSFTAADLHAVENSEEANDMVYVTEPEIRVSFLNSSFSMKASNDLNSYNNLVFTLEIPEVDDVTEDTDILDFTEDGNQYWIGNDEVSLRLLPTVDSEQLNVLNLGDEITRISYGTNWSYIRADEANGFVLTAFLTDIKPEPTLIPSPTPTPTPIPTEVPETNDDVVPVEEVAPTVTPTSTPTPTPTPIPVIETEVVVVVEEETEPSIIFSEDDCDLDLYASCALNVRIGPDISYDLSYVLDANTGIHVIAFTDNGWYKLDDGNYVKASLTIESLPETPVVENSSGLSVSNDFGNYCLSFVGTPYVYAGSSPSGFDCSGFAQYVMANYYGISLPHNADSISQLGTAVTEDQVMPGDILCHDYDGDGYVDHVSVYVGDGLCVHASNSREGVISSSFPMGSVVTIRRFL